MTPRHPRVDDTVDAIFIEPCRSSRLPTAANVHGQEQNGKDTLMRTYNHQNEQHFSIVEPHLASLLGINASEYTYELPDDNVSGASGAWRSGSGDCIRVAISERHGQTLGATIIRYENCAGYRTEWDQLIADPTYSSLLYAQAYVQSGQVTAIGVMETRVLTRYIEAALHNGPNVQERYAKLRCKGEFIPSQRIVIGPGVTLMTASSGKFTYLSADWGWLEASGVPIQTLTAPGVALGIMYPQPSVEYRPLQWLVDAIAGTSA